MNICRGRRKGFGQLLALVHWLCTRCTVTVGYCSFIFLIWPVLATGNGDAGFHAQLSVSVYCMYVVSLFFDHLLLIFGWKRSFLDNFLNIRMFVQFSLFFFYFATILSFVHKMIFLQELSLFEWIVLQYCYHFDIFQMIPCEQSKQAKYTSRSCVCLNTTKLISSTTASGLTATHPNLSYIRWALQQKFFSWAAQDLLKLETHNVYDDAI